VSEPLVTIHIPRGDWNQIVDDIENMCGVGREEIEILQSAMEHPCRFGACEECK
jgi:hypothetical protein